MSSPGDAHARAPRWLEVTLEASAEMAEAAADVLARFAPGGVAFLYDRAPGDGDGPARPAGLIRLSAYLPADAHLLERRKRLVEALWHLSQIQTLAEPSFRLVADEDWSEVWRRNYHPLRVGRRLVVMPSWTEVPLGPEDVAVVLDPGMAFGTGTHPSTQLCLELLESLLRPGMDVIDLGCGSGILSIAAAKLGARRTLALDSDLEAVGIAEANVHANGMADRVDVCLGSLEDVLADQHGRSQADLVIANILAGVLTRMLGEGLARAVRPGGWLVLSGILAEQSVEVEGALSAGEMTLVERRQREDWVALVARPREPS